MKTFRMMFVAATMLLATPALADLTAPPPPDFGDCTAAKQKKTPTDECQECNNLYQDGCEKQLKDKGLARMCQVKPENANEWREVWCKAPAKEPEKPMAPISGPVAKAETPKADTKTGGCAVDPSGQSGALVLLAAAGLLIRKRRD